jgi:uncharacterized protein (TIGR03067 family)
VKSIITVCVSVCAVILASVAVVGAEAGKAADSAADQKALQGTWRVVLQEMRGGPGPGDPRAQRMVFAGDTFKLVDGDKVLLRGTFTLDASRSPRVMEMKVSDGAGGDREAPVHGIYELRGDELAWCAAEPGSAAGPQRFETKGTTNALIRMKRAAAKE